MGVRPPSRSKPESRQTKVSTPKGVDEGKRVILSVYGTDHFTPLTKSVTGPFGQHTEVERGHSLKF